MGQRKCCVNECKSANNLEECKDVRFHAFPTNEIVRNMWVKNCHIEQNRSITKSNVICSRHFLESDYPAHKHHGRRLLNVNAVPTIFQWGNEKSFSDYMADAQDAEPTATTATSTATATETQADKVAKAPSSDSTPVAKSSKKMMSRSQANSAAEKQRSASAEEKAPNDSNAEATNKVRKSLDSVASPEKPITKENVSKSPSKKFDIAMQLVPGAKVEVQDLGGSWHNASVAEVDQGEQEVLINFEKNVKAKGPTTFKLNDEWIAMDSSRLRIPVPIQFKEGDRCLARWTDSRKFPATVLRPMDNNKYEVLFDDGCMKVVRGIHMSKMKRPANEKTSPIVPVDPLIAPVVSIAASALPVTPVLKKPAKINPIPKFDLSEFNLPEIPEGEWCCPWINDTPIGEEGFLLNADGSKRPTVLVQDNRLPSGWTKHLYQRSSTSGKWDVVLVGPNNKRFRSKNDVKVYLEEIKQPYNPDIYDFSIHKRRAKDISVYVYTKDYVPPVTVKPASDFKLDSSLDSSFHDFKQEPFPGFSPNESASSILSKITQEMRAETSTPIKLEFPQNTTAAAVEDGYIYVGALKVQMIDNLFQCPKEDCNKHFRKENHLQIHVKHYHQDLAEQLGACPNMTELAYFRTMGSTIDEPIPKNQIPNTQFFEKTFQSEMRTTRKSTSPTRIKSEPVEQTTSMSPILETAPIEGLKRKHSPTQLCSDAKEKRKATAIDKDASPGTVLQENMDVDEFELQSIASATLKRPDVGAFGDVKPTTSQKALIPRFKIGPAAKIKTTKISRRKGKTFKKKFKKMGKGFKRKVYEVVAPHHRQHEGKLTNVRPTSGATHFGTFSHRARSNRLKFLQYSSTDSNSENSNIDLRSGSHYINENGEVIKIVRMRQEEIIHCLCSYPEEDGLMVQCELCLCWQHGGCNGIEKESEVPEKYVCYICRNPEKPRESMKYIHDQEWLYDGKLFHANYHPPSRQAPVRFDILKQSHTLTGNLLELKRSLHSLNVKINIAANKDHPKMYLWSKKWEQSPPRSNESNAEVTAKIELKPPPELVPANPSNTPATEIKNEITNVNAESSAHQTTTMDVNGISPKDDENQTEKSLTPTATINESTAPKENDPKNSVAPSRKETEKIPSKECTTVQQTTKQSNTPKRVIKPPPPPNIPEPEAAIDSAECQHRLLEHIQKEQNSIISRMQTIDAQIVALESMDDHPDTNSPADMAKTSQTIRMLLNDLAKMKKLASINETSMVYNHIENNHCI